LNEEELTMKAMTLGTIEPKTNHPAQKAHSSMPYEEVSPSFERRQFGSFAGLLAEGELL